MRCLLLALALLLPRAASADMYQDASNASFPGVLNNLKLGPGSPGLATTDLPLKLQSIGPPPVGPVGGLRSTVLIQALTGSTPVPVPGMYATISRAAQQIASNVTGPQGAEYIGLVGVGEMSFPEGGWSTTTTAPALAGATSMTVASTARMTDGASMRIVQSGDVVRNVTVVGAPVGGTVTFTPALQLDTPAGATVFREMGYVRGMIGQATMTAGAAHAGIMSAEFAVSSRTGATPAFRTIVGISSNFDDDVQSYTPFDAGLALWGNQNSIGYKAGIQFDNRGAKYLVAADGTLIRSLGGFYGNGIDFSTAAFTGYSLKLPGMTVAENGRIALTGSFPDIRWNDTNAPVTTGGLWRLSAANSGLTWQSNSAAAGDFTTSTAALTLAVGSLQVAGPGAEFKMRANAVAIDAGGLWRTVAAAGAYTLQVNGAVAGDFSTALSVLSINKDGDIFTAQTTALPVGAGFKHLFIPTMAGLPVGTPSSAAAGRTAVVWDSTNKKLCAYNQPTAAWACSAAFTP